MQAAAVIQLVWSNPARTRALVRLHVNAGDRWIDRQMAFMPGDLAIERGRAIGFTIASILSSETNLTGPGESAEPITRAPAPPPGMPKGNPSPSPPSAKSRAVAEQAPVLASGSASASAPAPAPALVTVLAPPSTPASRTLISRLALTVAGVATRGLGGPASGLGVAAQLDVALTATVWVRGGGGARRAGVPHLNGDDAVTWGALGTAWRPRVPTEQRRLGAGLCVDLGLLSHDLSHDGPTGGTAHGSHVVPGVTILAEGAMRLSGSLQLILAIGTELAFGTTEVEVANRAVATIPIMRGLAQLGVRVGP